MAVHNGRPSNLKYLGSYVNTETAEKFDAWWKAEGFKSRYAAIKYLVLEKVYGDDEDERRPG
jgi:hypothetical protein